MLSPIAVRRSAANAAFDSGKKFKEQKRNLVVDTMGLVIARQ
jgi:hypothetical protein